MNNEYSDVLVHHGRKGQKWGVTNGPPYPLDYSDLSPEEKRKAGKKSPTIMGKLKGQYKLNTLDQKRVEQRASAKRKFEKYSKYKDENSYRDRTKRRAKKEEKLLRKYEKAKSKENATIDKMNQTIRDLDKKGYKISTMAAIRDDASGARKLLDYYIAGPIGGTLIGSHRARQNGPNGRFFKVERGAKVDPWTQVNTSKRARGRRKR